MKKQIILFAAAMAAVSAAAQTGGEAPLTWDVYPDTWVGTDGAGRVEPTQSEVGKPKTDKRREVGIFYVTWHTQDCHSGQPPHEYDVTKVLNARPEARLAGDDKGWPQNAVRGAFHWGEPEMGYFLSADPYVIRHDVSAIADAGIDVLILDVTNSVRYWDEWEALFRVLREMKDQGQRVPKFCFWVYNGIPTYCAQEIYDRLYRTARYKDLWYCRDGKPLLLYNADPRFDATPDCPHKAEYPNYLYDADAATNQQNPHYGDTLYTRKTLSYYPKYILDFFSLRNMWWGYYKWNGKRYVGMDGNWSFGLDMGDTDVQKLSPRERTAFRNGQPEEIAVTPAQHPVSMIGKSWRISTGEPKLNDHDLPVPTFVPQLGKTMERPTAYGIYYQDRWDEALGVDPQFVYLNDWNEWTAGKYMQNPPVTFMGRPNTNYFFVDQYNEEFNRTIGPMKDGFTDNYYMQTVANIRRYKGVRPIPENHGLFTSWDAEPTEYRDTRGDITHRDYDGYTGLHYRDTLGRNDILLTKVGTTRSDVLFRVTTAADLTPAQPHGWMMLFIDADQDSRTGWHGYDYMAEGGKLHRYDSASGQWKAIASLKTSVEGKDYHVSIPRKLIGAKGSSVAFDFKWADNPANLDTPIGLALGGDTAPNRRFNYRYIWHRR